MRDRIRMKNLACGDVCHKGQAAKRASLALNGAAGIPGHFFATFAALQGCAKPPAGDWLVRGAKSSYVLEYAALNCRNSLA